MPLPLPDLDTRQWADLVDEARGLIPRYAPNWTDHNAHDPGITVIELLAWLVELDIYRLNQIPVAHQQKFLRLVQMPPAPATAAHTWLGVAPSQPTTVPAGTSFQAIAANAVRVPCRTLATTTCAPVVLQRIYVQAQPDAPAEDQTQALASGSPFAAFGDDPVPGCALWLAFDRSLPPDFAVRLALTFDGERSGADERARIAAEPGFSVDAHHSVSVIWEVSMPGDAWLQLDPRAGQVVDTTRALTLDGTVDLHVPRGMGAVTIGGEPRFVVRARLASGAYDARPLVDAIVMNAQGVVQEALPLTMLGVRPDASISGTPPGNPGAYAVRFALDPQARIATLAFVDDPSAPALPILLYVPPSGSAAGILILELALLGASTGLPRQILTLGGGAVADGALQVYTAEPDGVIRWDARADFDASTPRDAHVVFDTTARTVAFGDGNSGRIPPPAAPILAGFPATLGTAGNLQSGRQFVLSPSLQNWVRLAPDDLQLQLSTRGITHVLAGDPSAMWSTASPASYAAAVAALGSIANPIPTTGGQDAETLGHAVGRAVSRLEAPTRAIASTDFEALALETPGTAIARVHALPGAYPPYACLSAPGVVSLLLVPAQTTSKPMPSAGLLASVQRYVGRRRMLGTHLEVLPPDYVEVSVIASVRAFAGVDPSSVTASILDALGTYLHPIRGGPTRTGWPFGRPVYRAEVLQLIDGINGVDAVLSLELSGNGQPPQCGNLCVGATQLTTSGQHTIEVSLA